MSEPAWRASRRKRAELALISGLGYPLLAALGSTYRYVVDGLDHLRAAEGLGHPIHAFWHGRILPGTFYFRRRGIVVITSENFDGEWIARIITRFGYGTARGSSSRGALKAMLQLLRDVKDRPVAFTRGSAWRLRRRWSCHATQTALPSTAGACASRPRSPIVSAAALPW
jgi:lysophospholipid acyltransferase (LPLAT)-like uncharacterized protein